MAGNFERRAGRRLARFVTAGMLALVHLAATAGSDEATLAALISEYGKPALIQVVTKERGGEITVDRQGALRDTWGRPNKDFVTERSLAADLQKMGMSTEAFSAKVDASLQKSDARKRSLERTSTTSGQQASKKSRPKFGAAAASPKFRQCLQQCADAYNACVAQYNSTHPCSVDSRVCRSDCGQYR